MGCATGPRSLCLVLTWRASAPLAALAVGAAPVAVACGGAVAVAMARKQKADAAAGSVICRRRWEWACEDERRRKRAARLASIDRRESGEKAWSAHENHKQPLTRSFSSLPDCLCVLSSRARRPPSPARAQQCLASPPSSWPSWACWVSPKLGGGGPAGWEERGARPCVAPMTHTSGELDHHSGERGAFGRARACPPRLGRPLRRPPHTPKTFQRLEPAS